MAGNIVPAYRAKCLVGTDLEYRSAASTQRGERAAYIDRKNPDARAATARDRNRIVPATVTGRTGKLDNRLRRIEPKVAELVALLLYGKL